VRKGCRASTAQICNPSDTCHHQACSRCTTCRGMQCVSMCLQPYLAAMRNVNHCSKAQRLQLLPLAFSSRNNYTNEPRRAATSSRHTAAAAYHHFGPGSEGRSAPADMCQLAQAADFQQLQYHLLVLTVQKPVKVRRNVPATNWQRTPTWQQLQPAAGQCTQAAYFCCVTY
jgi:hypothetical protein